jgi:hypothetical protein
MIVPLFFSWLHEFSESSLHAGNLVSMVKELGTWGLSEGGSMSVGVASDLDRRNFIRIGIAAGAGLMAMTALPAAINGIFDQGPRFTTAAELNHRLLTTLVGDKVAVSSPTGAPSELIVERMTPATTYASSNGRVVGDSFSIFFEGRAGVPLDQATYELKHPSLGVFPVFLSPVGLSDGPNQRYEAVFNRLR